MRKVHIAQGETPEALSDAGEAGEGTASPVLREEGAYSTCTVLYR